MKIRDTQITALVQLLQQTDGGYRVAEVFDAAISEIMSKVPISKLPHEWMKLSRTLRTTFNILEKASTVESKTRGKREWARIQEKGGK